MRIVKRVRADSTMNSGTTIFFSRISSTVPVALPVTVTKERFDTQ